MIVVVQRRHSGHRCAGCEIRFFLGLTQIKTGLPGGMFFLALAKKLTGFTCLMRSNTIGPINHNVRVTVMSATASKMPSVENELATQDFIAAMGKCATGVTVITTDGPAGRFGVTVSAMCSVSAEPPLLLVCVNRNNLANAAIHQNRCFSVGIIGEHQQHVAQVFAGQLKPGSGDRFSCAQWSQQATGAPVLEEALASFDCEVVQQYELGTHTVFVGKAHAAASIEGKALAYSQRSFCSVSPR
ncbi:flavin reductase family protein [Pseudomonas putida]